MAALEQPPFRVLPMHLEGPQQGFFTPPWEAWLFALYRYLEAAGIMFEGFLAGVPAANAVLKRVPVDRTLTFPANFGVAPSGGASFGTAIVAATAITTFLIQRNGVTIGTMVFAAAATTATFTTTGGVAMIFTGGQVLSVVAPAVADATLAGVGFVLSATDQL